MAYLSSSSLALLLTTFSIICWQHVGRTRGLLWRPSHIIDLATEQLTAFWTFLGKLCVYISSFYTWLDLWQIFESISELCRSITKFFFSFKAFIESYTVNMKFYDHPYLISLGSVTIIAALLYITCYIFGWHISLSNYIKTRLDNYNNSVSSNQYYCSNEPDQCINNQSPKRARRSNRVN